MYCLILIVILQSEDTIMIPILQMKEQRHREIKVLI